MLADIAAQDNCRKKYTLENHSKIYYSHFILFGAISTGL
jgi:hypothetical protein